MKMIRVDNFFICTCKRPKGTEELWKDFCLCKAAPLYEKDTFMDDVKAIMKGLGYGTKNR